MDSWTFDMRHCPKCGRLMVKDRVKAVPHDVLLDEDYDTGVIFWCLCGHAESIEQKENEE